MTGLVFPGKAGGGTAFVSAGTMKATVPTPIAIADAAARIHPATIFTVTQSRSRQVAPSPSIHLSRSARLSPGSARPPGAR